MLKADFQTNANQDDPTEYLGAMPEQPSKPGTDPCSHQTAKQGDHPDKSRSGQDIDPHHRKTDPDSKGVDTGGDRLHQQDTQGKTARDNLPLGGAQIVQSVEHHLPADCREQSERDPMVKCADRIAEGASGKIACDRHQRLKQPERGGGLYRLPAAESPVGKPVGEGNGKRIHRKSDGNQKE